LTRRNADAKWLLRNSLARLPRSGDDGRGSPAGGEEWRLIVVDGHLLSQE
jgi:hypothetical protein